MTKRKEDKEEEPTRGIKHVSKFSRNFYFYEFKTFE